MTWHHMALCCRPIVLYIDIYISPTKKMERVHGDWIDEELALNEISIPDDDDIHSFPTYSMKEHFASPWENREA